MNKVKVECINEFEDLEFEERRKPGDTWETSWERAEGLSNGDLVRLIAEDGTPICEKYPWGEPRPDRWLETATLKPGNWNRVVACLNIWNDLDALKETYETWYPHVDHVIAVDGVYDQPYIKSPESRDGTIEFLRSLDKVTVIYPPLSRQWEDQIEKRNKYFKLSQPGDLLFVVDADEYVHGAQGLKDLPDFDVGWVVYHKNIYKKKQQFPRLFKADINPRYFGRHYWLQGDKGFITNCQKGGSSYDHAFIPGVEIDNTQGNKLRSIKRKQDANLVYGVQHKRESNVGDAKTSGRESLRVVQLTSLDPGMVVFRLHSAINATSPHESVMGSSRHDRVYDDPYQWDVKEDRTTLRAALRECDIVHCHLSYQEFDRLGIRTEAPVVMHHHGSMYRSSPEKINKRDSYKADVRLVSNPELLQYADNIHFLPNPVPVERYKKMREMMYEPDPDGYIRIGHSPSKRKFKGTEELVEAVDNLKKKGLKLKLILIEGETHAESLRKKARYCDVFFDSFWLSAIQCSGLEAGAMGIPTIGGDEDVKAYFENESQFSQKTPYLYANSLSSMQDEIESLYNDKIKRKHAGLFFQSYVQQNHDYAAVTSKYLDILDEELNWRERLSLGRDLFLTKG